MWLSATNTSVKNYVEKLKCRLGDHLAIQMGPHGGQSYGKVFTVQALLVRFANSRMISVSLDLAKFIG